MPFKDTKEGTTHSYNDGCGESEHNQPHNTPEEEWEKEWEKLKCEATQVAGMIGFEEKKDIIFIRSLLTRERALAYEQGRQAKGSSFREGYERGLAEKEAMAKEINPL